jgi:hypothetical protein
MRTSDVFSIWVTDAPSAEAATVIGVYFPLVTPHAAMNETFLRLAATFSPNAIGVGAGEGEPSIARTPMAKRLNVSHQAARGRHAP